MAKEAYYFSHDSNARHDPKITAMRSVYGSEGYGWFWIIVEMMREADQYKLEMQGKYTFNAYAMQMHTDSKTAGQFITDCIDEFGLFHSDGTYFWSPSLLRRMDLKEQTSEKRREAANKRWGKDRSDANASEKDANAMQGKESKGNKNENTKELSPDGDSKVKFFRPTLEQVREYCEERNNGVDADKWFDHYTAKGWKVGKVPMKDWRAAVRTWERTGNGSSTVGKTGKATKLANPKPDYSMYANERNYEPL